MVAMAVTSQAVSIQWAGGGTAFLVSPGGTEQARADNGTNPDILSSYLANSSLVLVYLGVNGTATTAANVLPAQIVATQSLDDFLTKDTTAAKTGRANSLATYTAADVVDATYQVFFSYNGELKDLYTTAAMDTAYAVTGKVLFDGAAFSANSLYGSGGSTVNFYAPVPEPATAALALAGLAMLIRRRK